MMRSSVTRCTDGCCCCRCCTDMDWPSDWVKQWSIIAFIMMNRFAWRHPPSMCALATCRRHFDGGATRIGDGTALQVRRGPDQPRRPTIAQHDTHLRHSLRQQRGQLPHFKERYSTFIVINSIPMFFYYCSFYYYTLHFGEVELNWIVCCCCCKRRKANKRQCWDALRFTHCARIFVWLLSLAFLPF